MNKCPGRANPRNAQFFPRSASVENSKHDRKTIKKAGRSGMGDVIKIREQDVSDRIPMTAAGPMHHVRHRQTKYSFLAFSVAVDGDYPDFGAELSLLEDLNPNPHFLKTIGALLSDRSPNFPKRSSQNTARTDLF
jgi:hypothetical protein